MKELDSITKEHAEKRAQTEQEIWDNIDAVREEQRDKLAQAVDEGIQQKGKLTLIKNEYEKYRAERDALGKNFEILSNELTKLNKQIEAHKQNIKS